MNRADIAGKTGFELWLDTVAVGLYTFLLDSSGGKLVSRNCFIFPLTIKKKSEIEQVV